MKGSKKLSRFARWSAHHYMFCLLLMASMPIPLYVLHAQNPNAVWLIDTYSELILFVSMVTWFLCGMVAIIGIAAATYHFENLCGDCATAFPLDAAEKAAKWQRALDIHHGAYRAVKALVRRLGDRAWLALLILFALTLGYIVFTLVIVALMMSPPWTAPVGFGLILVPLLLFAATVKMHFRLAPWCEGCNGEGWGDGGPEEPSPDIPPLPVATKIG